MKRKIKHFIQVIILPFILSLFVRFIYLTNKKVFHHPLHVSEEPFILALWHRQLLMQAFNYKKFKKNGTLKAIISQHRDGQTINKVLSYIGVGAISGSSTRGGAKALLGAIKTIKNGYDVAITPDGPKGPIYEVASGIVAISNKTNAKIMPCKIKPSKYWQASSWDKFIIPKPFGKIDFYIGEAFSIDGLSEEEAKQLIKEKLGK